MPASWLDPRLEPGESPIHGRGTFAITAIGAGEVVVVWEHQVLCSSEVAGAAPGELWSRGDGTFTWLPPSDSTAPEHFLNHSCHPNVGMKDEVTLVARRAIEAGEELTADYALWELDPKWVAPSRCRCASSACRGTVTGQDWESPELQRLYAGYFHPAVAARIANGRRM